MKDMQSIRRSSKKINEWMCNWDQLLIAMNRLRRPAQFSNWRVSPSSSPICFAEKQLIFSVKRLAKHRVTITKHLYGSLFITRRTKRVEFGSEFTIFCFSTPFDDQNRQLQLNLCYIHIANIRLHSKFSAGFFFFILPSFEYIFMLLIICDGDQIFTCAAAVASKHEKQHEDNNST